MNRHAKLATALPVVLHHLRCEEVAHLLLDVLLPRQLSTGL